MALERKDSRSAHAGHERQPEPSIIWKHMLHGRSTPPTPSIGIDSLRGHCRVTTGEDDGAEKAQRLRKIGRRGDEKKGQAASERRKSQGQTGQSLLHPRTALISQKGTDCSGKGQTPSERDRLLQQGRRAAALSTELSCPGSGGRQRVVCVSLGSAGRRRGGFRPTVITAGIRG